MMPFCVINLADVIILEVIEFAFLRLLSNQSIAKIIKIGRHQ